MAYKLNLGAGYSKYEGFLNVDNDVHCEPDYLLDIEKDKLPFDDNSVDEIILNHVLEHIGDGFFDLLKEIYRVSNSDVKIHIRVPHHRHDNFLNDPTHKRPISVEIMKLFSKSHNKWSIANNDSSSKLGLIYDVDFEIIDYGFSYDPMFQEMGDMAEKDPMIMKEFEKMVRINNNIIMETYILLTVIK